MEKMLFNQILEGIEEARCGNTAIGLRLLKDAARLDHLPEAKAWLGYCLARETKDFRRGIALCNEVRQINPENPEIYLAMGRIYLQAGHRPSAVKALHAGLALGKNPEILSLLQSIGMRKLPIFPFMGRKRMVNIATGRLLSKIGIR